MLNLIMTFIMLEILYALENDASIIHFFFFYCESFSRTGC